MDSGCTRFFTYNENIVHDMHTLNTPINVTTANGLSTFDRTGTVKLKIDREKLHMDNVAYVPQFNTNLMSVSKLTDLGYTLMFDSTECK